MVIPVHATILAAALALTVSTGTVAARPHHTAAHAGAHHHHNRHHHHHFVHRGNQAASSGDRHASHPVTVHKKAFGAPVWEPPPFESPYPYAGKLAGDGVLGTGWLDSNVMRAWGVARN